MKTTTALLAMLLYICLHTSLSAQENTKGQLWYGYEETVKPSEVDLYKKLSKEILVLCKEANFPFPIYVWTPGEFKYQLWSPIDELNDIDKIGDAWNKIMESWDQEKNDAFAKTKIKNNSFTSRGVPDLHYLPENPRYKMEDVDFGIWQEALFIPGKLKEAKEIIKEMNTLIAAKEYNDPMYFFEAGMGYETPMLIAINYALNPKDHLAQQEKWGDAFTEEELKQIEELNSKVIDCTQTIKVKRMWRVKDLDYVPDK